MNKLINALSSVRLAIILLILLIVVSMIATIIPGGDSGQAFTSWWYIALLAVFSLNLLSCTIRRITMRMKISKRNVLPPKNKYSLEVNNIDEIITFLKKKKYEVEKNTESVLFAEKNSFSWWGSIVFHTGMILLLVAFLANSLWGFNGYLLLTERITSNLSQTGISKQGKFVNTENKEIKLKLTGFKNIYGTEQIPSQSQGKILFTFKDEIQEKDFLVNKPVGFKGIDLIYTNSGFSPLIEFKINNEQLKSYLNIASLVNNETGYPEYKDIFEVTSGLNMTIQVYPDFDPFTLGTKSYLPNNPVLKVTLSDKNEQILDTFVELGDTFDNGVISLSFLDLRQWVGFKVNYDPAETIIIFSLLLITLGTTVKLIFPRKRIWVEIDRENDNVVLVSGKAEYYNIQFQNELHNIFPLRREGEK